MTKPTRRRGSWPNRALRVTAVIVVAIVLTSRLTFYTIAERRRNDAARVEANTLQLAKVVSLNEFVVRTGTQR